MSESILNAIVQLFALIANATDSYERGKKVVTAMLKQQLSPRFVDEYLILFENYLEFFLRDKPKNTFKTDKGRELLTEYVEKVCSRLRKELPQNDRIIVFIKVLEFVNSSKGINKLEEEIVDTLASCFSIDKKECENLKYFVLHTDCQEIEPDKLLVIDSEVKNHEDILEGTWVEENKPEWQDDERVKLNKGVKGKLSFLFVSSIGNFVMRYWGDAELYLDGMPIEQGTPYLMDMGAIIRGPSIEPIYYTDLSKWQFRASRRQKIVFTAQDLEFNFRNSNNGIKRFSFSEESGQLIGIMGGSGVGKTTLLNLLTGKLSPTSGRVLINGYDIHNNRRAIEGVIGYVPQDDLLFEELTVYQNLYYNAKLCFSNFTEFKIRQAVKRILDDLDLWETRNLKVGSPLNKMISGGQRKRLNIGLELLREPSILFVDEPTSGLSSNDSMMVMRLLKEQASKGKLVIVNIHQPSSKVVRLLDKLWVLDKGGYPIYSGNPQDAIIYFKTMSTKVNATDSGCPKCGTLNPEEILDIVEARVVDEDGSITHIRRKSPEEWYKLYVENIQQNIKPKKHKNLLPRNFFNIPNIEVQFKIFSIRNLLSKLSNKQYIIINLIEAPILAFILAFFTKHIPNEIYAFADNVNYPAYLFMSVVVAMFIGLTVSAEEIINDKKILERESFLNLSRFSYLNAKIFYLFALSAIQMAMFVLVGNTILEVNGMMLNFWLILFSTACFSNMVGLNISAGLNSVVAIYITIPFILVPQILLSGTIVQFDNLHPSISRRVYTPIVGDVMISRWAYEALSVEQFKKNAFEMHFFSNEQSISNAHFVTSFLVPRLQILLDECTRYKSQDLTENPRYSRNLKLIQNELIKLHSTRDVPPFELTSLLTPEGFTTDVGEETSGYLSFIRLTFSDLGDRAKQAKDSIYSGLADSLGNEKVFKLKQNNYNKTLADWVLNNHGVNKYLETSNQIIQKYEPIFMVPNHNWGRAHFYAPVKRFNNQYVDTIWFNLAVIWMASLLLFITLQMNLLGGIISYFEKLRFRKQTKRHEKIKEKIR
ncbi:MAG: ATP-binding cassette domain-containing protein [Bacteroidales bacterium]